MTNTIALDQNYSTTRLLVTQKPEIVNKPEDKFETILFLPSGEGRQGEGGLRTRGYFKQSYEDKPLISIITVVFNGEKYLEETIQSVINQTYDNVEYIIIDGGSTDGTLDIIKKHEDYIDYWVSEKDSGIYDAMNKGITLCVGELIGIINSDDWYEKEVFVKIINEYTQTNKQTILHGNMNIIKDQNIYFVSKFKENIRLLKKGMILNHPTIFVPISIYKKLSLFSTDYKIASDWEFILRCYINKIDFLYINVAIANFRLGGASFSFDMSHAKEKHLIRKNNGIYRLFDKYYFMDKIKIRILGKYLSDLSNFKQSFLDKLL